MSEAERPSAVELLKHLRQADAQIAEAPKHCGAVQHLTGDRRNQKRYQEEFALLDATIRDTDAAAQRWSRKR